jgi:hypothetical protein
VWNRCRRLSAVIIRTKIAEVKICTSICHTFLRIWTCIMPANTTYQKDEEVIAWGNLPKPFQNIGSQRWYCITVPKESVFMCYSCISNWSEMMLLLYLSILP